MKPLKFITYYVLGIAGIICISVVPQVFATKGVGNLIGYFQELGSFLAKIPHPEEWVYQVWETNVEFPILDVIWEPFLYSMLIFLGAVSLGLFLAFVLAIVANFLPHSMVKGLKRIVDFLESIPDLVIAISLQMLSVYAYKAFGVDLFKVAGFAGEKVFFAPIVTLAILPMISLFKILFLTIEEELLKDYVGFLKSKGIQKIGILLRHVIRNVLPTTFHHSKVIIWATLSSQFVIERIFNVEGVTYLIVSSYTPMTIAVTLILIYTPFFMFFQLIDRWVIKTPVDNQQMRISKRYSIDPLQTMKEWVHAVLHIQWRKIKPWKPIINVFKTIISHMKNYKIAIGCLFFIGVISISFIYSITTNNHVDQQSLIYEADGLTLKSAPPHPPGEPFIIGSDKEGKDLLDQLIIGAKYTLLFGLLIAFLRVFIGMLGGIIYAFSLKVGKQRVIEKLVDSIHFLPLSVIAYVLLAPIILEGVTGFAYSLPERIILEVIILTVLVVPLTSVLIGNDMKHVLQNEFIASAKVLGGGKLHILFRHVLPHIGPRLTILIGQQFIQVLLIFMHLGVYGFFLGGTNLNFGLMSSPPTSVTNEWSSLIGSAVFSARSGDYWLSLFPLLGFMLSIFAMQFIIQGVKEMQQVKVGVLYKLPKVKRKRKIQKRSNVPEYQPTAVSFQQAETDKG